MEPTSEQMLGQSKFISTGEMAASPFFWAVSLFITESSSATSAVSAACGTTSSFTGKTARAAGPVEVPSGYGLLEG